MNEIVEALLQFDIDLSSDEEEQYAKLTDSARERKRREEADNYHI